MSDIRLIDANTTKEKLGFAIEPFICSADDEIRNDALLKAIAIIDSMPTEDAQPVKRGKWEWEPGYVGTTAKCSVCGLSPMGFYSLPIIQIGRLPEYPFCPNCGSYNGGDADETP